MAAVDGGVLSLETTALTESENSNERYLGHYLQSIDRAMRTGGEDGVVVEDWATIHTKAQERATALSRKDTPTDLKTLRLLSLEQLPTIKKYNEERDLLNIIAGVIGDKDIGGFGIEEDRSLLGVTLYDVDLDEDWEEYLGF